MRTPCLLTAERSRLVAVGDRVIEGTHGPLSATNPLFRRGAAARPVERCSATPWRKSFLNNVVFRGFPLVTHGYPLRPLRGRKNIASFLALLLALVSIPIAHASVIPLQPWIVVPKSLTEPKTPDEEEADPAKLAERIASNTKSAGDRLAMNDPGRETQSVQDRILKDIDKLLKQPPPPPMGGGGGGSPPPPPMQGDQPPPMGGGEKPPPMGGGQPMPMGGQQPPPMGGGQPMPMGGGQPMPMGGQQQQPPAGGSQPGVAGATSPKSTLPPLDDRVVKDVWGHLPPNLRQKMNQYYQEQFMPRYADLLKQYYAELAEREPKK